MSGFKTFVHSHPTLLGALRRLRRLVAAARHPRKTLFTLYYRMRLKKCGRDVDFSTTMILRNPKYISIGNRCSFGDYVICDAHGEVTIGDDCMFASGTIIATASHDYTVNRMNLTTVFRPVVIEDNVWCGVGATIMPGVRVGTGAVIGARALVLRDVAPNVIVVGVPARVLAERPSGSPKVNLGAERL